MSNEDDALIQRAYRQFERAHDAQREELLARLPMVAASDEMPEPTRHNWRLAPATTRWVVGLAAMILLALGLWFMLFPATSRARAVADIPKQLARCRNVYVDGWIQTNHGHVPYRLYVEWPGFYWYTTNSSSGENTSMGYVASDGRRYLVVNGRDRTATFGKEVPIAAELRAQMLLQTILPEQLIGSKRLDYKKTGSGIIRGIHADIYDLRDQDASRRSVWLDRTSGLPVQAARYEQVSGRGEQQVMAMNIVANGPRPEEVPGIEPPTGYRQLQRDHTPQSSIGVGSGTIGKETQEILLALNIEDRAILLGWTWYSDTDGKVREEDLGGPIGQLARLRFQSADGLHRYREYHLRDDPWNEAHHVRWSLLVPEDSRTPVGDVSAILEASQGRIENGFTPLRFDRDRLAEILAELQRVTVSSGVSQDPILTLDQLTSLLDKAKADR